MRFKKDQIVNRVKEPFNSELVQKGRNYESRLRLFTEPMEEEDLKDEFGWKAFKKFLSEVLSLEQDLKISEFIQFPLTVTNITESIVKELYKVFDASNSFFDVNVLKSTKNAKIEKILSNINIVNWIEEVGKSVIKNSPNTIIVIDKDKDGNPYPLAIENDRLIDVMLKDDGITCEYITFLHSVTGKDETKETRYSLYDDYAYYVILKVKDQYKIEKSTPHGADECPARMFVNKSLNSKDWFSRFSHLASSLSKLNEWQQFDVYKYYTDHYAPFPVQEMVKANCSVDGCQDGFIMDETTYQSDGELKYFSTPRKCPACENRNKIGIGGRILIDPVEDGEKDNVAGKFRMISNDVKNLEYIQGKLNLIEMSVTNKIVGVDALVAKTAINKTQVIGSFESKTNILLNIKSNLDDIYVWIVSTIANIYIKNTEIEVNANFGTEWYLKPYSEINEDFKKAIESGLPTEEIDLIYNQLIETKYKGNPYKIQRLKLINSLNPVPYKTFDEKKSLLESEIITKDDFIISERLVTFVKRFEKDNGDILDFGIDQDDKVRLNTISKQFRNYIIKESTDGKEN